MHERQRPRTIGKLGVAGALYFVLFLGLQWLSGAYSVGFGGDPDEPAHYVTGLMVRDYLAAHFPAPPLAYAENYYVHYPQVAFGHWPPMFHLMEAAWMMAFPVSHSSMMALMALLTAGCATALYALARQELTDNWAVFSGLLFLALPTTVAYGSLVMAEMPLALMSTISLIFLIGLLTNDTLPWAIAFGAAAAATALVKPSGFALLLVPLPAALLMNERRRVVSPRVWIGMAIAIVLALPVHALTLRLQREGLEGRRITLDRVWQALAAYVRVLPGLFGWVVLCLLAIGIAVTLAERKRSPLPGRSVVALVYLCSVILFHALVPTVAEPRKLFMAIPICVLLAVCGLKWIAGYLPRSIAVARLAPSVLGALALAQPVWSDLVPQHRAPAGFEPVAEFILSRPELAQRVILVSAVTKDGTKEGILIAEIASRDRHRPSHFVLRASKQLMHSTWNGLNYVSLFSDADQMRAALNEIPVGLIVVDGIPGEVAPLPHQRVLAGMLHKYGSEWKMVYHQAGSHAEEIGVFASTRDLDSQPIHIEVDLRDKLNQVLRNAP